MQTEDGTGRSLPRGIPSLHFAATLATITNIRMQMIPHFTHYLPEYLVSADGAVYVDDGNEALMEVGRWDGTNIEVFDQASDGGSEVSLDMGVGELEGALTPRPPVSGDPLVTPEQIGALRDDGLVVVDHFLSAEEVASARAEINGLSPAFEPSANTILGVRKDLVGWVKSRSDVGEDGSSASASLGLPPGPNLQRILRRLESLIFELNASSESGLQDLLLPCQAMIGSYQEGGFFSPHKDNELCQDGSKNWTNPREVTAVLYFNVGEEWASERGGCLKCYLGADGRADRVQNVQPHGGRLVLFKSRELLHEVTKINVKPGSPCLPRLALTLWAVKHMHTKRL